MSTQPKGQHHTEASFTPALKLPHPLCESQSFSSPVRLNESDGDPGRDGIPDSYDRRAAILYFGSRRHNAKNLAFSVQDWPT